MLIIEIPEYPEKVQLSQKRRAKYYTKSSKSIPQKYKDPKKYQFKKGILTNIETGEKVVKNSSTANKPRFKAISGNELISGMHPRIREKIYDSIKSHYKKFLPDAKDVTLKFPVKINMKLYSTIKYGDWDLDNAGIFYIKTFQDLLVEKGILPNDSIKYITKAPSPEFYPVDKEADRKIVFELSHDSRPCLTERTFYGAKHVDKSWIIKINDKVSTGEFMVDVDNKTFAFGIGKKHILPSSLIKSLRKVAYYAINMNVGIIVPEILYARFSYLFDSELSNYGINVITYDDKSEFLANLVKATK